MSITIKPNFFLLVRCEDPKYGPSFCVISDLAIFFDSNNLDLQINREVKFEYPEDNAIFQWPTGHATEKEPGGRQKKKRGRKVLKKSTKTFFGIVIEKSCKFLIFDIFPHFRARLEHAIFKKIMFFCAADASSDSYDALLKSMAEAVKNYKPGPTAAYRQGDKGKKPLKGDGKKSKEIVQNFHFFRISPVFYSLFRIRVIEKSP